MMNERERLNKITEEIIGTAIEVHRVVGLGLLESAYEACLVFEFRTCAASGVALGSTLARRRAILLGRPE